MGSDVALPFSYTKIFEEVCPYYMAMGMTYDEFWNDNPKKAYYYRKAFDIKQDNMNTQAWLQGIYVSKAIECTIGNMFSKKSSKKIEYFKEPLPITEKQIEEKKKQEEIRKQELMKAKFMQYALSINANLSKKGG